MCGLESRRVSLGKREIKWNLDSGKKMSRGRPWQAKPFRIKKNGEETGSYRLYVPSQGKTISLETADFNEATKKAAEIAENEKGQSSSGEDISSGQTNEIPNNPEPVISKPLFGLDNSSVINDWINSTGPVPPVAIPQPPQPPVSAAPASTGQTSVTPKKATPQKGLTTEQTEKISGGMKKIIARMNVIGLGTCIQLLGRDPYPVEDEELELLAMGWEMWIEEVFTKKKMEPWHLVLAANVMIGFSMYIQGTPKPKDEDETPPQVIQ